LDTCIEKTGASMKNKILIVDDHPIVRHGLKQLIDQEEDLIVCAEADNTASALRMIASESPDIAIVDIHLGESNGIELIKLIRSQFGELPILVISLHEESHFAERALKAGAMGYIMKQELTDNIMTAIRKVLDGQIYVSEAMASKILQKISGQKPVGMQASVDDLSDREIEVFRLIGQGYTTRRIADQLHLSVKTIETYRMRIKDKLHLDSTNELLMKAFEWVNNQTTV